MSALRDIALARKAKKHGASYSLRIILEARRAGIPISLGFALVEQESAFANIYGHDPTIFAGAGKVTKTNYAAYKARRGAHGEGGMQGVGPVQLTYWSIQDRADRLGGCWKPAASIRVGFEQLAGLIAQHGDVQGIASYNGSGPAAQSYAKSVRSKQAKWHERLVG